MKLDLKNGSSIQTIETKEGTIRSKRAEEQIAYWKRNPDRFAEWILGHKLPLYQRLWFKLFSKRRNNIWTN